MSWQKRTDAGSPPCSPQMPMLQRAVDRPASLDRGPHQLADAFLVERREGVVREDAVLEVVGEELALGVVAREPERGLGQVVGAEREEVGVARDLVSAHAGPRQLDHRSDQIRDVASLFGGGSDRELAQPAQLFRERHERVHDLDVGRPARALTHGEGGADDGAHLHLVDLRPLQAESAAARPEHRVRLVQCLDPLPQTVVCRFVERGQELVQRRVEQPDRHRQSGHRLEDALEVALLERQ